MTGRIADNWSVIANYTHDDVRTIQGVLTFNPATVITTGSGGGQEARRPAQELRQSVGEIRRRGALKGFAVGGGVSVYESALGDKPNSFILPGYALLNGMIAYNMKIAGANVTAQLNVRNITDVTYFPSSNSNLQILPERRAPSSDRCAWSSETRRKEMAMKTVLHVEKMFCKGCAAHVIEAIQTSCPGVDVSVDLESKLVSIDGAPDSPENLVAAIGAAGYVARLQTGR